MIKHCVYVLKMFLDAYYLKKKTLSGLAKHFLPEPIILRAQTRKLVKRGKKIPRPYECLNLSLNGEKSFSKHGAFKNIFNKLPWELTSKKQVDVLEQMFLYKQPFGRMVLDQRFYSCVSTLGAFASSQLS